MIVYNLLTPNTLDLPYLTSAGFTPRTTTIPLGDCLADEWVCTFGEQGIAGWATDTLNGDVPAHPAADPRPPRQRTSSRSTAASQPRSRRAP